VGSGQRQGQESPGDQPVDVAPNDFTYPLAMKSAAVSQGIVTVRLLGKAAKDIVPRLRRGKLKPPCPSTKQADRSAFGAMVR
jgi:hypothetical protein